MHMSPRIKFLQAHFDFPNYYLQANCIFIFFPVSINTRFLEIYFSAVNCMKLEVEKSFSIIDPEIEQRLYGKAEEEG